VELLEDRLEVVADAYRYNIGYPCDREVEATLSTTRWGRSS
jgi:hypothetical protein